jgi:hypothetical protein
MELGNVNFSSAQNPENEGFLALTEHCVTVTVKQFFITDST